MEKQVIYITREGSKLELGDDNNIVISYKRRKAVLYPIGGIESIIVIGNIDIGSGVISAALLMRFPIVILSNDGSYFGRIESTYNTEIGLQSKQFERKHDKEFKLSTMRILYSGAIGSMRLMIQRYIKNMTANIDEIKVILDELQDIRAQVKAAATIHDCKELFKRANELYYKGYGLTLPAPFSFNARKRKPPTDMVNSMLSLAYSILFTHVHSAIATKGLNAHIGLADIFPPDGSPELVYDLMGEFRHVVADTVVRELISRNMVGVDDFEKHGSLILLNEKAKDILVRKMQAKLETAISYISQDNTPQTIQQLINVQAGNLKDYISGSGPEYGPLSIR